MEYESAIKKEWHSEFRTVWMDPDSIMLSEINQAEKETKSKNV